jgi:hypothetical protein
MAHPGFSVIVGNPFGVYFPTLRHPNQNAKKHGKSLLPQVEVLIMIEPRRRQAIEEFFYDPIQETRLAPKN